MILDGTVEFAAIDNESGEILYTFPENKNILNPEDNTHYFFYDQLKNFFANEKTETGDEK
jgi:hypothetical protein